MNPVFHLYQLQKIDSELHLNLMRLHAIDLKLRDDVIVKRNRDSVESIKAQLNDLRQKSVGLDEKIQTRRTKLEQSDSSLYSGTIKNPKELQDLQKEISHIKSTIAALEDEQLELLIQIEALEENYNSSLILLQNSISEFEKNNYTLISEKQRLEQENSRLFEERDMVSSQVSAALLEVYESLREKKKGIAISKVEEQTCSVCGTTLTPAECQSAKFNSGNIRCPSCGRILYAD